MEQMPSFPIVEQPSPKEGEKIMLAQAWIRPGVAAEMAEYFSEFGIEVVALENIGHVDFFVDAANYEYAQGKIVPELYFAVYDQEWISQVVLVTYKDN